MSGIKRPTEKHLMLCTGRAFPELAEEVAERFPNMRASVLSSDLFHSARALKDAIAEIGAGQTDIIIGTQLVAQNDRWAARKQWLADHLRLAGRLVLDDGAARAVTARHTSLLPIGVIAVEGEFLRGDAVACVNSDGREVARGLANYSSDEARMIMRHPTRDIERLLGYVGEPELIHRDNLVNL